MWAHQIVRFSDLLLSDFSGKSDHVCTSEMEVVCVLHMIKSLTQLCCPALDCLFDRLCDFGVISLHNLNDNEQIWANPFEQISLWSLLIYIKIKFCMSFCRVVQVGMMGSAARSMLACDASMLSAPRALHLTFMPQLNNRQLRRYGMRVGCVSASTISNCAVEICYCHNDVVVLSQCCTHHKVP